MIDKFKTFILGILAGFAIAVGGTVFLSVDNKIVGALLFTVGLFVVCTFGFYLFTGKVCYVFENDREYAVNLIFIWFGNLAGAVLTGFLESLTRIGDALAEKAALLCDTKLSDNILSIFILSALCNIMIFVAVDGFNKNKHELGKYLSLFFGIAVFILCGFEHCVANMYYFTIGHAWSLKTVLYLLVMTAGNTAGGVALPLVRTWLGKRR